MAEPSSPATSSSPSPGRTTGVGSPAGAPAVSELVRIRGLPWGAGEEEILAFFQPLELHSERPVTLVNGLGGKPTGEAFVRLASAEVQAEALKYNRQMLGKRYIEVFAASDQDLELSVQRQGVRDFSDGILRCRGLPFNCQASDVASLFGDYGVTEEHVSLGIHGAGQFVGSPNGEAWVRFGDETQAKKALEERNMQTIGCRYVELYLSSEAERQQFQNFPLPSARNRASAEPLGLRGCAGLCSRGRGCGVSNRYARAPVFESAECWLRARGLPYSCCVADLCGFFAGHRVSPDDVVLGMGQDGRPTGEALVRLPSAQAAEVARQALHRRPLGSRYVELFAAAPEGHCWDAGCAAGACAARAQGGPSYFSTMAMMHPQVPQDQAYRQFQLPAPSHYADQYVASTSSSYHQGFHQAPWAAYPCNGHYATGGGYPSGANSFGGCGSPCGACGGSPGVYAEPSSRNGACACACGAGCSAGCGCGLGTGACCGCGGFVACTAPGSCAGTPSYQDASWSAGTVVPGRAPPDFEGPGPYVAYHPTPQHDQQPYGQPPYTLPPSGYPDEVGRREEHWLRLRGAPITASVPEISRFFSAFGAGEHDVVLWGVPDSIRAFEVFVRFSSAGKAEAARAHLDGQAMGGRYIELLPCASEEVPRPCPASTAALLAEPGDDECSTMPGSPCDTPPAARPRIRSGPGTPLATVPAQGPPPAPPLPPSPVAAAGGGGPSSGGPGGRPGAGDGMGARVQAGPGRQAPPPPPPGPAPTVAALPTGLPLLPMANATGPSMHSAPTSPIGCDLAALQMRSVGAPMGFLAYGVATAAPFNGTPQVGYVPLAGQY